MSTFSNCNLCPHRCLVDRNNSVGFCRSKNSARVARYALHFGEEPCISGKNGSGTIFFSGCTLRCVYCQNYQISRDNIGCDISDESLAELILNLQAQGAENINFVTPSQFVHNIINALNLVKSDINIPIVYNCGGYESIDTLKILEGYVDIYLTDIKYMSSALSKRYSNASDYFEYASSATKYMISQAGSPVFEGDLLKRGVIIRHLVLPGCRKDSLDILDWIANNLEKDSFLLSIMSQYTPVSISDEYSEINRRITTFEYKSVLDHAKKIGLYSGYMQDISSAQEIYIPPFSSEI